MKRLPFKNATHCWLEMYIGGAVWRLIPFLLERKGSTRTKNGSCQLKEPPDDLPLMGQAFHKIMSFLRLSIDSSRTKPEMFEVKVLVWGKSKTPCPMNVKSAGKSPWHTLKPNFACLLPFGVTMLNSLISKIKSFVLLLPVAQKASSWHMHVGLRIVTSSLNILTHKLQNGSQLVN